MISDITAPDVEPLNLDYAKTFLRVDHDGDDALILDLIRSARERVEGLLNATLITRTRRFTTSRTAGKGVFINHHPITSVDAVTLLGDAGERVVVPLNAVSVNLRCQPPTISLKHQTSWASILSSVAVIDIDVTAGFGTDPDDIPMPLRQAMLLLLAQSYEHRGDGDLPPTPLMVDALLMPYRLVRI